MAAQSRSLLTSLFSVAFGLVLSYRMPFPDENDLLQFVLLQKPYLFYGIKWIYVALLFTTPYIAASLLFSLAYIFLLREQYVPPSGKLPPYPEEETRDKLFLVVGELHHTKRPGPSERPQWLIIPERGLFTGVAVFGAIGTGKTSGAILPFAEQVLGYQAKDPVKRVGGLVLEAKGDLCQKVKVVLSECDRLEDYVEVSLQG